MKRSLKPETLDFETLYRTHLPLVRSALRRLGRPEDLEDLIQETFLRVWTGLPHYRGEGSLKGWICRIAYHCSVNRLRKRGRLPVEVRTLEIAEAKQEERDHGSAQILQASLAELSELHRTVLLLHCVEGSSLADISRKLGVPVGTVKSRLHHARLKLQQLLRVNGMFLGVEEFRITG